MPPRRVFIAGSTGVIGQRVVRFADERGVDIVPHVRPKHGVDRSLHPRAAVCALDDAEALASAMKACTTVVQLIGTLRKRFAQGDTYETSDIGTTRHLVEAAKRVGVDHFVLLSSVGAGKPRGAYLKAKAAAEAIVKSSGLPFTLVRPSGFTGASDRHIPEVVTRITQLLGLKSLEPIHVDDLARTLLSVAAGRLAVGEILEGESLWKHVREASPASSPTPRR